MLYVTILSEVASLVGNPKYAAKHIVQVHINIRRNKINIST